MRKLITVTDKHIKRGHRESVYSCPVALALADSGHLLAEVDGYTIEFGDKRYKAPRSVERFVSRFDNGKPVKPFRFFLKVD